MTMKPAQGKDSTKLKFMEAYAAFVKKEGRPPTRQDLDRLNISREMMRSRFGTLAGFRKEVKEQFPDVFLGLVDEVLFSTARLRAVHTAVTQHKRFVITTAVSGCKTHEGFAQALDTYCKAHDALLLVMVATDPASHSEADGIQLDAVLSEAQIVVEDVTINRNLFLSSIKLSAKQIDPTTGLNRFGQRSGSFIFASPKQFLNYGATGEGLPHAIMTTGAITTPDYAPSEDGGIKYMSQRTAYIAEFDHVLGAVVVEVEDHNRFHFRQVQAEQTGAFVDLGVRYSAKGTSKAVCEALVLGDWHSGETDPVAAECFVFGDDSVRALLKPKRIVIHDGFNGKAISHHEAKSTVSLARRSADNQLSLEAELIRYAKDLDRISGLTDEVLIVESNHDNHLGRYLREGRFILDPPNIQLSCQLLADLIDGLDPVRNGVARTKLVKRASRLRWLVRDESYRIAGTEVAAHGDLGANGARGSMRGAENAYGSCVIAHAHTPGILRSVYRVGTTSLMDLGYNTGPSSWLHTSCVIYSDGSRQLINVIDGHWRSETRKGAAKRKAA